jgi:hypothetical protein
MVDLTGMPGGYINEDWFTVYYFVFWYRVPYPLPKIA